MPKITYTNEEIPQFELLASGPYPFEVVGCDVGIQNGGKCNGCDKIELKLMLFSDVTFTKKVGQLTKLLIFPQTRKATTDQFLQGGLNMFVKSAAIEAEVGKELELDEMTCLRRRGWCKVGRSQVSRQGVPQFIDGDKGKPELRNEVDSFITDKGRLERAPAVIEVDDDPFAEKP